MSTEAMKWAMELAPPMPAHLIAVLSGLAYHADRKGCGAYPAVPRLAAYACKAERSVIRDLKELRTIGLIRYGDQTRAEHLPEGKRPDVYDLALEMVVPGGRAGRDEVTQASRVTLASSRRRGGRKKPSPDAFSESGTPDVDVTSDVDVTPDVDVRSGVTPTSQVGCRPRHPNQKKNQEPEERGPSSPSDNGSSHGGLHSLPDDFHLNDAMRRWSQKTFGPAVDPVFETDKFIDYWRSEGRRKTNWHAAWQKWMRDAADFEAKRAHRPNLRAVSGESYADKGIY